MSVLNGKNKRGKSTQNTGRKSRTSFVTKSGQTIKINRSLGNRIRAYKEDRSRQRALRLAGMPKSRVKRFFYRLHPKRMYRYWFSREGVVMALKIIGIGTLASFLLVIGVFAYFRKDLPNIKDVSGKNIGGSILYYDRTGKTLLWEDVDGTKRIPVKDENISPFIKQATIAIEDKDFFKHGGFDVRGIIRAGVNNAFGQSSQGGSTITQQLVRLTQPEVGKEHTYKRKIKELILSVELEREYSKKDILTGYLNAAPYGGIEWGVEAAAQDYFHKSAKDLSLEEAAMLAGIPKSPTYYSPYNKTDFDKEALIGRQHYILDLMEQQGMITAAQRDAAKKVDVLAEVQPRKQRYEGIQAPWFVLTAKQELERRLGNSLVKRGGWTVITTLDLNAQKLAEEQVNKGMAQVRRQGGDTAGFVAEDVKTGQVVALVGGIDFLTNNEFGQNNYAHDLELPPGSSFKPYDYAALIENQNNAGAGSVIYDSQGPVPGYACTKGPRVDCLHDYDFRYPGPVTLRYALGGSRNVPAIKAMLLVGVDKTIDTAHRLMTNFGPDGQPDPSIGNYRCYSDENSTIVAPCYASSAIGDGAYLRLDEHVHGYATLSRNGLNIPQTYIMKVTDAESKVIDEWELSKGTQAVRPDTAYIVSDMLSDPNASYFPGGNKPQRYKNWKFSVKTGTTNDSKDGLMMMYSTQYAAGVWVGYHNRQRVMSGFMEVMTQPIIQGWMRPMHDNLKVEDRVKPGGVKSLPAFIVRGHVGSGSIEPSPASDLFPSWYQTTKATGKKSTIDIISNKLATDCTPARARKDITDFDANSYSVDTFVKQGGANITATDDVHQCTDAKPDISLSQSGNSVIATVTPGTHPLSGGSGGTVNFIINGQVVNSAPVSNSNTTISYTPDLNFTGQKEITAEVVDSVLYDKKSNGVTLTGTGGASTTTPLTMVLPAENQDIGTAATTSYTVSWIGGTAPYSVKLNNVPQACTPSANSCTVATPGPDGSGTAFTIVVSDNAGHTDTRHFHK